MWQDRLKEIIDYKKLPYIKVSVSGIEAHILTLGVEGKDSDVARINSALESLITQLLKDQREKDFKKILDGLISFTEKPLGTIEGDVCDWNKPSVFAGNYSPQELENKVVKRIKETFNEILNSPEPK